MKLELEVGTVISEHQVSDIPSEAWGVWYMTRSDGISSGPHLDEQLFTEKEEAEEAVQEFLAKLEEDRLQHDDYWREYNAPYGYRAGKVRLGTEKLVIHQRIGGSRFGRVIKSQVRVVNIDKA